MYKCVRIFENGEKERKKQLERKSYGDQWAHEAAFRFATVTNGRMRQLSGFNTV